METLTGGEVKERREEKDELEATVGIEGEKKGAFPRRASGPPAAAADPMEAGSGNGDATEITAENCYRILTQAKTAGAGRVRERDRAYRFMSDHYLEVLRSPAVFGRLTAGERELILARRMEGAERLAVAESGDAPEPGGRRRVFCLDPASRRWEVLTALPEDVPAKGYGMCTMFNYLFVAGGIGGSEASARVFCFNPRTGAWSRMRPLTQPRCQLKLVAMDGCLYAVGGECLLAVERYDPRADRWAPVAPLPRGSFAVAHEATSSGGELFVSGGSLFYRLLRYDSRRDEWEECPFNESRRRSADMVAHRGSVYRFDVERERAGVSVYKYSTVVKAWHAGAFFPLDEPLPFRCAVLGDRIFCVNRSYALQFEVRDDREGFLPEALRPPAGVRGTLVPFVLTLARGDALDPPDLTPDKAEICNGPVLISSGAKTT